MARRFNNLKTLANLHAYIDKAHSTSADESLSQQEKERIKKYLILVENALKEKKHEEVKQQLELLNQYFHSVIKKAASSRNNNLSVLDYFVSYRNNVLNHIAPYLVACTPAMLPQFDSSIPQDIVEGRKLAYQAACAFKHEDFASRGDDCEKYNLGPNHSDEFVQQLAQKFPKDLCIVDLGTGRGGIVKSYNETISPDEQHCMWGIESENNLALNDPQIIRGDLGDLPRLKDKLPKKIHAFISRHTFNFLFDPLKTLCDAYDMVEVGGCVSINPIKLQGLSAEEGESLFAYLCEQGYDIQAKKDDTCGNSSWNGWIRIQKNSLSSLNLPLHYNGTLNDFSPLVTTTPLLVAQYTPNLTLLKFKAHVLEKTKALSAKQFNDILKTYKTTSFFFKSKDHSKAIKELRKLSNKSLVTELDIENALRPCSLRRFNLFANAAEKINTTDTDRIIRAYRTALHLS